MEKSKAKIRRIDEKDTKKLSEAASLIKEVFMEFNAPDYSNEGVKSFIDFVDNEETARLLEYFGAYEENVIKGVIAVMKTENHICCFFVKADSHGKGIARQLWEHLKDSRGKGIFTVNSSPYAVPIYRKLGFEATGKEQIQDGIRFTPMKWDGGSHMPAEVINGGR